MTSVIPQQVLFVAVDGSLRPMRAVGFEANRIQALDADGNERWLASKRIYWISEEILTGPECLMGYWEGVSDRAEGMDLKAAWLRLPEEKRGVNLEASELMNLIGMEHETGNLDALAVAIFRDLHHFKVKQHAILSASTATVQTALDKTAEEERQEEAFGRALLWLENRLQGEGIGAGTEVGPETMAHIDALKSMALFGLQTSTSRVGLRLLEALVGEDPRDPATVAFELLCRLGIYQAHENLAPHRAGLERSFSKDVLAEVESVAASPLSLEGRRDMTHLTTVSIDDPHTSEIDDAFALDGNRLHVFIADVAHFVPTGGQLDEEASERMSTVYLPEGKIPMLPGAIGQELASLNRGEVRPVLCFSGTIDARGGFSDFELCEALCSVDHRLDYASVDLWLSEGGGEPSVMPALRALDTWSEAHLDRRLEAGAMVFQRKEIHTTIDVDGRVHLHQPNANGSSRLLIAEMMVAICFKAARYLRDNRLPAIYRGQAPPDVEIDATRLDLSNPVVEYELLRKVKPSTLSLHPRPHAALGASCYAQITSPIRRYADLLLHRQLKSHLRGVTAPYDVEALGGYLADIEQKQGIIRRVERDSNRYWLLRYLEQNPGQELEAIVLRRLRRRWLVNLPALCIPATLLARGRLHPGQLLRVRVTDVDACRDVLVLDEV